MLPHFSQPKRFLVVRLGFWLPALISLTFWGCGSSERSAGLQATQTFSEGNAFDEVDACIDGTTRDCSVTLSQHNGVLSCYHGTQSCTQGTWGPCGNGTTSIQSGRKSRLLPGSGLFALSTPQVCIDNPCDPYCQTFDEDPDDPVVAETQEPEFDWEQGSLASFPGGLVQKGLEQPCETGFDCQFNMSCNAPSKGECEHSVCEEGSPLVSGCSDCVDMVCAADSTCCPGLPSDVESCDHDPCLLGEGLESTCNTCVNDICTSMPDCCDTQGNNENWTQDCVDAVAGVCGNSCGCGSDETAFGGKCYYYETTNYDFNDAEDECEDRGSGWGLVTINDDAENTMVSNWNPSHEKFIGFKESKGDWYWTGDADLGKWDESTGTSSPSGMYTSWASGQPVTADDPDCAYMGDDTSNWYGETSCNSNSWWDQRDSVCEGPTWKMQNDSSGVTHEWSDTCVDLAESLCDVQCDPDDPADSSGACVPWYPGQTDPKCAGVDLAVGVPCDGVIPVCNHGNTTAELPIEVVHFPANSKQYPLCNPDTSHPEMVTCEVPSAIPPGECVNIDGDTCLDRNGDPEPLNGNREIMVNPTGAMIETAGGEVTECSCLDNWSLYSHGASECGPPACSGGNTAATQVTRPVDIIVIIDNSPSMNDEIEQVQARIHTDLAQILEDSSLDYRVIMISRFGDVDTPVGTSSVPICIGPPLGANACTDPANETLVNNPPKYFHFSTDIESFDSWCQLLYGFNHADEVGTTDPWAGGPGVGRPWTSLAPGGWSQWLREDAFKTFLVITDDDVECSDYGYDFDDTPGCDGFPHNCHNLATQTAPANSVSAGEAAALDFDQELRSLSPAQFGTADARNYVWHSIVNLRSNPAGGAWQPDDAIQTQMCTPAWTSIVGAGTGYQALSRLTGGLRYPICQNQDFDAIFNAIAEEVVESAAASCNFELPNSGGFDPNQATVSYTTGDETNIALSQVDEAADCGSSNTSWYYDDPADPTTLSLCPDTCSDVQADPEAQVWVELGCPGAVEPTPYLETYEATCPDGHIPQWTFLGYETSVPSDAEIVFQVRTADSEADLDLAPWQEVATATTEEPDCSKAAPVPGSCPVDLYEALGMAAAQQQFLELDAIVIPSSDGQSPVLESWHVDFSCPPGE